VGAADIRRLAFDLRPPAAVKWPGGPTPLDKEGGDPPPQLADGGFRLVPIFRESTSSEAAPTPEQHPLRLHQGEEDKAGGKGVGLATARPPPLLEVVSHGASSAGSLSGRRTLSGHSLTRGPLLLRCAHRRELGGSAGSRASGRKFRNEDNRTRAYTLADFSLPVDVIGEDEVCCRWNCGRHPLKRLEVGLKLESAAPPPPHPAPPHLTPQAIRRFSLREKHKDAILQ
jgi:hypothetical protein